MTSAPDTMNPQEISSRGQRYLVWLLALLLVVAVGVSFGRTVSTEFIDLDDARYVFDNPRVTGGLTPGNIVWACTTRHAQYWIPLTWLSLQVDATLTPEPLIGVGPQQRISATVFHVSNIVYHAGAAVMLMLFLRRATGNAYASFVAALLWSVHPLRVESVGWVTERKDVLSGLFGFLALYLYVGWARNKTWGGYLLTGAAATASLMAKPMTLAMPCVWLLLDFWPLGRWKQWRDFWPLVQEKLPMFVVAGLSAAHTYWAQRWIGNAASGPMEALENSVAAYGRYMWMQVDFRGAAVFYPYVPPPGWLVGASAAALVGITLLAIGLRRKQPAVLVGWLWYLGTFVPTIGLFNVGTEGYADRFTYFPVVGLAVVVAWAVPAAWYEGARLKWTLGGGSVVAAGCMGCTIYMAGFWQGTIPLFERNRAIVGNEGMVLRSLASGYRYAGRYDDAIAAYGQIDHDLPGAMPPEAAIAGIYLARNETGKAEVYMRKALAKSDSADVRFNLGLVLLQERQWNRAIDEFEKALEKDPNLTEARAGLERARRRGL